MEPFDSSIAVNPPAWEWLLEVSLRLDIIVEVIDARDATLLPRGQVGGAADLRRLLTAGEPSVAATLAEARRSGGPTPMALAGFQALGFGLPSGTLLVVARELNEAAGRERIAEDRRDLERAGTWLLGAIQRSLSAQPNAINPELYRLSSLKRILATPDRRRRLARYSAPSWKRSAYGTGCGCVATPRVWTEDFSTSSPRLGRPCPTCPARSTRPSASTPIASFVSNARQPTISDWPPIPATCSCCSCSPVPIPAGCCFSPAPSTVRLRRAWRFMPICSGNRSTPCANAPSSGRLAPFRRMRRRGMGRSRHLSAPVLHQIAAAAGGQTSSLTVTTVTGMRALTVGDQPAIDTQQLVVTSADAASVMTITLARSRLFPFTAFEREIAEAAAAVLHPWIRASLLGAGENERRRGFRPLDSLFDHIADQAVVAGQEASVIVVSVDPAAIAPGLLQSWLGNIRIQLRASDFAGMLSDSEIAVLLCDASADQASAVSARLKDLLQSDESAGAFQPFFSTTTSSPQSRFEGSLVGAARSAARIH